MFLGCFQSNRPLHQMAFDDFARAAVDLGYASIDVPALNDQAVSTCRDLGMKIFASGAVIPPDLSKDGKKQAEFTAKLYEVITWAHKHGIEVVTPSGWQRYDPKWRRKCRDFQGAVHPYRCPGRVQECEVCLRKLAPQRHYVGHYSGNVGCHV